MITISACSASAKKTPDEPDNGQARIQPSEETGNSSENASEDDDEQRDQPGAADRLVITFETMDGRTLEGFYYPARLPDAAVIVLMHWAPGTMEDWHEIALWLQNRQDELTAKADDHSALVNYSAGQNDNDPWLDPSWFPILPPEVSFGVLIFNFGGRGNSEEGPGGDGLFYDALAAVAAASALDGIDSNRITTMGASIGADGSVDGCQAFNAADEYEGTCLGAFSLSPGSYMNRDYGEMVNLLRQETPPKTVFCLAAANDGNSWNTCQSAVGDHFEATEYEGSAHGMKLISPNVSPGPLTRFLEFLQMVYGITLIN
jgi:hypothetical protein